ncbi:MAG TPA: C40 family peptidase, partial [Atopostipes sp.]|nr:C40 family peptidase [Atopostipes sp.]
AAAEQAAQERAREEEASVEEAEVVEETTEVASADVAPATSNRERDNTNRVVENESPRETSQPRQEQPSNNSNSNNNNNNGGGNRQPEPSNPAPAPKPKPKPEPKPEPKPAPSGNLISTANSWLGVPYDFGGNSRNGIDCSAFVQQVFSAHGKSIPRTTWSQYATTQRVSSPSVGDLVFFSNGRNGNIDHVGIYTGNGQFIGAQTSTGVAYASLTSGYWASRIVGYGRY